MARRDPLEEAKEALAMATQGQKDLRELRGYPGYKEALNTSAREIDKAEKRVKKEERRAEKGR